MFEYVSRVALEVNGQTIEDFNSVSEGRYELRKQVRLMNKTGHVNTIARYTAEVEYVIPFDSAEFDFDSVENGTLTIDYLNGKRVTYTGVCTLEVGQAKHDGEKESTKTIQFGAEGRLVETTV